MQGDTPVQPAGYLRPSGDGGAKPDYAKGQSPRFEAEPFLANFGRFDCWKSLTKATREFALNSRVQTDDDITSS